MCPRPGGSPWPPDMFSTAFAALVRRSGMRSFRFHDLRHSHASHLLRAGIHPKIVSERLGHSTSRHHARHLLSRLGGHARRRCAVARCRAGNRLKKTKPTRHEGRPRGRGRRLCTRNSVRLIRAAQRPLSGVKRTWRGLVSMSANDPKRTCNHIVQRAQPSHRSSIRSVTGAARVAHRQDARPRFIT